MGSTVPLNAKFGTPTTRLAVTLSRSASSLTSVACSCTRAFPVVPIVTLYDGIQRKPRCTYAIPSSISRRGPASGHAKSRVKRLRNVSLGYLDAGAFLKLTERMRSMGKARTPWAVSSSTTPPLTDTRSRSGIVSIATSSSTGRAGRPWMRPEMVLPSRSTRSTAAPGFASMRPRRSIAVCCPRTGRRLAVTALSLTSRSAE